MGKGGQRIAAGGAGAPVERGVVERGIVVRGLAAARYYAAFARDPIGCLTRQYRERGAACVIGNVTGGWRGERLYMVGLGPEYNRQVFSNPAVFANPGQFLPGPAGSAMERLRAGLTQMNGEKYRRQRQLLLPLFTPSAIQSYHGEIGRVVSAEIASWPKGKPVDLWELVRRLTLRCWARILFARLGAEQADHLGEMIRTWIGMSFSPGAWLLRVNWRALPYGKLVQHAERLEAELLAMIAERRRAGPAAAPDMLDLLIQAHDEQPTGMTETDLIGQAAILFTAGFETQTNALCWTLYLIAQHPEVAADLHDELTSQPCSASPTLAEVARLPFLDAVLKESLRILPPVPFTLRKVQEPAELGGVRLAIGDRVICSHYVTHHLPEIYDEPERFLPQRWRKIKPTPYEYLPYGAGPRYCLGGTLANAMMKTVLAMLLPELRIQIAPQARIDRAVRITMNPKYGLPAILHAQDRAFRASEVRGNIHEMVEHDPAPVILKFPSAGDRGRAARKAA